MAGIIVDSRIDFSPGSLRQVRLTIFLPVQIEATALQVELLTLGRVEASFTLLSLIRSLEFTEFLEKFIVGLVVQEPKVGAAIFNQQTFRVV